ncbi:MAG: tRNA (adenosine(37)-N6)-dimethylallyltransferase MiaA, partial [Zetaproteobacteria bacterium]
MNADAVALVGPTASGKSALALAIAERVGAPIIACDSMQVYVGLDIGTAKPTPAERARVPHMMIDVCTLPDRFSAQRWADEARRWIAYWRARGRVPLIVGGTGLYLRALVEGLSEIPAEDPEVHKTLIARAREEGTPRLHAELARVDPETAARLHPNDTQRVVRALSVYLSSGKPISHWQKRRARPRASVEVFVLELEAEALRARIRARFAAMLKAGWWEEVKWLAQAAVPDTHPAVRAVGYRQLLRAVRNEIPEAQAIEAGIAATWQYAKRQRTWFAYQTRAAMRGPAAKIAPEI